MVGWARIGPTHCKNGMNAAVATCFGIFFGLGLSSRFSCSYAILRLPRRGFLALCHTKATESVTSSAAAQDSGSIGGGGRRTTYS
ncbi:hypothetical protein E2562_003290 [Oryza meyeriana var. granulata]|uniref:Uncharacterized protein n=1 Tax=Oryza meyeriana var. granulata TaxID=110450 RepID=A0A6G1EE37_9ORYZ|nr:hypothetical protein E2562_003290 [Oryza meyeriana var. granulata]